MAVQLGFSSGDQTRIATAISELARNIVTYAQVGEILLQVQRISGRAGLVVTARDEGPGIGDIDAALRDGYSTTSSLGMGLPGTRRLMDEFTIASEVGKGTVVTTTKWQW
jgi:serine/threonine-protein kinase RsbT